MSILRYENVNWSVPFLFNNQYFFVNLAVKFHELEIKSPVKYVYGYMQNKWNGNEPGMERIIDIEAYLKQIGELGSIPVINFSNYHVREEDLDDIFCNKLLQYGIDSGAEYIVSSDLLYDYIKSKCPDAKFVCSEIKSLYELEKGYEVEFYNKIYDKYERITLSQQYVKDGFINDISKYNDISKFEVIVNDNCLVSCSSFKEHNESVEDFEMGKCEYFDYHRLCPKNQMSLKDGISKTLILSRQELDNLYNAGIKTFRLKGFCYNPVIYPEIISSYIFNPIGVFQHVGFMIDDCLRNNNTNDDKVGETDERNKIS